MARLNKIGLAYETYYVYIMTNEQNSALYIGITSDIMGRCTQHIAKHYPNSFTARYNINKLVYYEVFHDVNEAISREKQLKAGSRLKKIQLIEALNPHWNDLFKTRLEPRAI